MTDRILIITTSGTRQAEKPRPSDMAAWSAIGERVGYVYCLWAGPRTMGSEPSMMYRRRRRLTGPASSFGWSAWSCAAAIRVGRRAERKGFRVVINGGEPWGWAAAAMASRLVGWPWLMDIQASYLDLPPESVGRLRAAVLRRTLLVFARHATARRAVSHATADALTTAGLPTVAIGSRLEASWASSPHRDGRRPDAGTFRLIGIGRLVKSKGFDLLISALDQLRQQGDGVCTLTLVGDGPEMAHLRDLSRSSGLEDRVSFVGQVDSAQVRELLSSHDALVISSRDEGLPRTLLEASVSGLPVLATAVGGIPHFAHNKRNVVLCEPTRDALARGILAVRNIDLDPDDYAAVRDQVNAEFSFGNNIEALTSLYRAIGLAEPVGLMPD
jgi:glycosyltransferase involved in cell wall biosynthesis